VHFPSLRLVGRIAAAGTLLAVLAVAAPRPAGAYGRLAVYQVEFSFNCNSPDACGPDLGGFWGWGEFDSDGHGGAGNVDAELTGCEHLQGGHGGGGGGAQHFAADAESWYIDSTTGTFWVVNETDTFTGHGQPYSVLTPGPQDTGIPAAPGHYDTTDLFGLNPPPGVAFQIQVVKIPNR
jgi:hypothetical protein